MTPAIARLPATPPRRRRVSPVRAAIPRNAVPMWPPGTPPPGAPPGGGIDLGAAVSVMLAADPGRHEQGVWLPGLPARMEQGVVIKVVAPGAPVGLARVIPSRVLAWHHPAAVHYVVQCWDRRVLRRAAEIVVDSP